MSNRDRACDLWRSSTIDIIEHALDEAERRGAERMRNAAVALSTFHMHGMPLGVAVVKAFIEMVKDLPLPGGERK